MAQRRAARPAGSLEILGPVPVPGFRPRHVRVYTPPGHDPARPTPLLVMLDGQNAFDHAPSFAGGWQAHLAVDRLGKKRARPIVVGVDHGGEERLHELSPYAAHHSRGEADRSLGWIAHALLPELSRRFALTDGPESRFIGGSSMGGLAALYAHFRFPEAFGGALAMSPSLWFAGGALLHFVDATPTPWRSRIYLDCGAREAGGRAVLRCAELADALRRRGYHDDRLRFHHDKRGEHNERSWRRRLPAALRFLFR